MSPSPSALSWGVSRRWPGRIGDGTLHASERGGMQLCQHNCTTCLQAYFSQWAASQGEELLPSFGKVVSGHW